MDTDSNENKTQVIDGDNIILLDGTRLECYPKPAQPTQIVGDPVSLDTTGTYLVVGKPKRKKKPTEAELQARKAAEERTMLFASNAFLFYRNADRILHDSRLFLAPVPVNNEMAYTGRSGFHDPTLGIYIEWWLNSKAPVTRDLEGSDALTWLICGSPLTGANSCSCAYPDGTIKKIWHQSFPDVWRSFVAVNNRYTEAKQRFEAYTFEEALAILEKY